MNVRGLRDFKKRKSIINWIHKQKADIVLLQETYSSPDIENEWKYQWRGDMFFAHGSNKSKGVLVLIKNDLDFEAKKVISDENGRFIIMEAEIQKQQFTLINIYAPNDKKEQTIFFENIAVLLDSPNFNPESNIIIGGDLNIIFDTDLDSSGGKPTIKDCVKIIKDLELKHDLIDIWRIRNPETKRFTWRQKTPLIQRRLDFWLVNDALQDDIIKTDIIPSIKTDHSAISLEFKSTENYKTGPSHWKFNSSFVNDVDYINIINMKYTQWLQDYKEVEDKRVLWDLIKYKIRQETIKYGKEKAKQRKLTLEKTEYKLREAEKHLVDNPNEENKLEFEICKTNYEKAYEYITKGSILRSRVKWYEEGEKNTKYFLNLENHQKKKSCIRRIYNEHNKLISNPKEILKELNKFYQNLYSENGKKPSIETKNKFLKRKIFQC